MEEEAHAPSEAQAPEDEAAQQVEREGEEACVALVGEKTQAGGGSSADLRLRGALSGSGYCCVSAGQASMVSSSLHSHSQPHLPRLPVAFCGGACSFEFIWILELD